MVIYRIFPHRTMPWIRWRLYTSRLQNIRPVYHKILHPRLQWYFLFLFFDFVFIFKTQPIPKSIKTEHINDQWLSRIKKKQKWRGYTSFNEPKILPLREMIKVSKVPALTHTWMSSGVIQTRSAHIMNLYINI